jgi:predicted dehydrogenase
MNGLRIGLVGAGFMGKAHAVAYHAAPVVFPLSCELHCELLAEVNAELAREKANEFGFRRATHDWRHLVTDPSVDVVDICSPNFLHKEMALAAIAAGKHVYIEKPLALNAIDAREMVDAAESAGIKTLVGFNYVKNPMVQLAREMITGGEIGEVLHFRGTHVEDYLAEPNAEFNWRLKRDLGGAGALADLGSHIINMAQFLVGAIDEVNGDLQIVVKERRLPGTADQMEAVENDDQSHFMIRFAGGAIGTIETSRIATGRKFGLTFTVTGTSGSIMFDQEQPGELKWFGRDGNSARQGFRTILAGPEHPDYRYLCKAAAHGIGYNDLKTIEVRDLADGICADSPMWPDFRAAHSVNQVIDAVELSHAEGRWIKVTG